MTEVAAKPSGGPWLEANHGYLLDAVAGMREALERSIEAVEEEDGPTAEVAEEVVRAFDNISVPPALDALSRVFGLSTFEQNILLLCAGMEMDASFASLCARVQHDPLRSFPTLSLALSVLPGAHWSALAPSAPLRYWRLLEVGTGGALTLSPLRIDERVLHYLAGVQHLDERLVSMVEPMRIGTDLVPSHAGLVERLVAMWTRGDDGGQVPAVQLCGIEGDAKRSIAALACAERGLQAYVMYAEVLPTTPSDVENLIRLWTREVALGAAALVLDCDGIDQSDAGRMLAATTIIERVTGPLIVVSRDRWPARRRQLISLDVPKPTHVEQYSVWQDTLGSAGPQLNGHVDRLVAQFDLSAPDIRAAGIEAFSAIDGEDNIEHLVWDACRLQARPRLEDLAQRIDGGATWDNLVLPEAQHQTLREILAQVRERVTVYEHWGFRGKGDRGLGITVLFAGTSGTGKTTAAEVLANELRLDLFRIDLSSLVSKYIGETEKNLRRVFDAAEEGGVVLLFDEADALFGKRSEVKDSHDRYANIEVSYLLQRMESYRGLAILTTNMRKALDTAFLRRIRFVVQFPFPDTAQRAEIWRRVFPAKTPVEDIDVEKLAQLNVAGGNIRNIALHAAFLAADDRQPVRMTHLLRAAQREYSKLEKPLTGTEMEGWV